MQKLLNDIKNNRWLEGFSPDLILPAYQQQSILNIPATLCHWFGIPGLHANPLRQEILSQVQGNIQRIILILMDGLALHYLKDWMQSGKVPVWETLSKNGMLAPITSVVPSTTSAAITTLWTGHSPAEHGVIGYELWLKEYGVVANMILQSPMSFKSGRSSLQQAGFKPEESLSVPSLGAHLQQHNIQAYSFQPYAIAQSNLSKTFMKNVSMNGYASDADLWVSLRQLIESKKDERQYIWAYTGAYDGIGHHHGPEDERAELEFINFSRGFEHNFLNRLTPEMRKDTLLILTADHGHLQTPRYDHFWLARHPDLMDALHIRPSGEHRLAYLHIKPGKEQFIRDYFEKNWTGKFEIHDSKSLLDDGLLGPGSPNAKTLERMGDLTVIAKGNHYLWWDDAENKLLGRHGGLTPEEMLVPFLVTHL